MTEPSSLTVELTEVQKLRGILCRPKSDGSRCRLTVGKARRHRMNGGDPAGALAAFVNGMPDNKALTLGRMTADVDDECHLVPKKRLPDYADQGDDALPTLTRTLDNFAFAEGPGWALVDHDSKGMPPAVASRLATLGGLEGALRSLIAGFDAAARVTRASTRLPVAPGAHHGDGGSWAWCWTTRLSSPTRSPGAPGLSR